MGQMNTDSSDSFVQIDLLVEAFFRSVSFASGERPNYGGIRELFLPSGLLLKGAPLGVDVTSVDEFIEPRQKSFDEGILTEFRETELTATTTMFGHAAHRESSYDKAGVSDGVAFAGRGIIFTQFVWGETGWRISSMAWDDEREGLALVDRLSRSR
jgi:hypothetical protein